jgi:hypothetical protein
MRYKPEGRSAQQPGHPPQPHPQLSPASLRTMDALALKTSNYFKMVRRTQKSTLLIKKPDAEETQNVLLTDDDEHENCSDNEEDTHLKTLSIVKKRLTTNPKY